MAGQSLRELWNWGAPYTSALQKHLTTEVKLIGWNFLKASVLRDTYYLAGVFVELICTAPSSFIVRLDFDLQLPVLIFFVTLICS